MQEQICSDTSFVSRQNHFNAKVQVDNTSFLFSLNYRRLEKDSVINNGFAGW